MLNPMYMAQVFVSFFVLMGILTYFLYKPVKKFMADRATGIEKNIRESQATRLQAEQLLEKYQKDMAGARAESQRILDEAVKQGQKIREQIIAESRDEASRIMAKSKADLEQEVVKAMALLRNEIADLAIKSAGALINRELDDASHRSLIQETLAGMEPSHD